jgi:ATP phosphoribosyltransferase
MTISRADRAGRVRSGHRRPQRARTNSSSPLVAKPRHWTNCVRSASVAAGCRSPCRRSWIITVRRLGGQRIATSYPGLLGEVAAHPWRDAGVVTLAGSVEIAPKLGTADAICDLVQSGGTLVANQLREAEVLLESEAVLAGPRRLPWTSVATCWSCCSSGWTA